MTTDTRLGTFEQILALFSPESARLATALRELIARLDGGAFEVPRLGEKATSYGVGPSKMKQAYCYIMPQMGYVNLGFFHGADLPDPLGLLEGTGKAMRHLKIRSEADLQRQAVLDLLQAAIAERRCAQQAPP